MARSRAICCWLCGALVFAPVAAWASCPDACQMPSKQNADRLQCGEHQRGMRSSQKTWAGRRWAMSGDSIVAQDTWGSMTASQLAMASYENWGVSGSRMDEVLNVRKMKDFDALDLYGISAGTNDFGQQRPIGTRNDPPGAATFWGAMRQIVFRVRQQRPNLRIFFMTPLHRADERSRSASGIPLYRYVDAIVSFGKINKIPVFDQYRLIPIKEGAIRDYLSDGLHPNICGGELISKGLVRFLRVNLEQPSH